MLFAKFLGSQMRYPRGIWGRFFSRGMNRTNLNINQATVQLLEIKPTDRVLDIGFGGGVALEQMSKLVQSGLVAGIEVSSCMLKLGRKKFSKNIAQGKMELKEGSSSRIPYESVCFDKICAVNCIYFWSDPVADLKEILRVLDRDGILIISVYRKEEMEKFPPAQHGFTLYSEDQLRHLLKEAGFSNVRMEYREGKPYSSVYAIATVV
jgi:ubiquinone/menaquinone biosynthesis C-methylase UbiE